MPKQPYGAESKQFLMDLIDGKTVGIKIQSKDRYGRYVVGVYTADGKDVSAELLKAGMAWHFKRYDSTPEYTEYETKAKRRGVGLWADRNPVAPWDFRRPNNRNRNNR